MTSRTPAHDYLMPRLDALVQEATAQGFARDVVVAVLIDLIMSPRFNDARPDPMADAPAQPGWDRRPDSVVLVHGSPVHAPTADTQDEADFVHPINPLSPSNP